MEVSHTSYEIELLILNHMCTKSLQKPTILRIPTNKLEYFSSACRIVGIGNEPSLDIFVVQKLITYSLQRKFVPEAFFEQTFKHQGYPLLSLIHFSNSSPTMSLG